MDKNKIKILTLAIFLRLLVSAFLFHPDVKTYNFQTSFLKKGVVNIYPYLNKNKDNLTLREEFVYFPLTYFVIGGYQAIASTIAGTGLENWQSDAGSNSVVENSSVFSYLILLKLPLLILDISIAFLLTKFAKSEKEKDNVFTLWLFNPFTIFLIYAFSNIDLYAVLLTVLALLFSRKKKLLLSSIFIGLAASFKMYPLLFIPFVVLKSKNNKERLISLLVPLGIMALTILPFWSVDFVNSALVSGLTTRIFSPGFSVGFGESIIVGLAILTALFFYAWLYDKKIKLINYWTVVLIVIFSFSHFHVSWLLWVAPFLVVILSKKKKLIWPVFLMSLLAILIPMFYSDRAMTISLFRIYTTWIDQLPTPFAILQKFYDPYNFQSMLHSAFAGTGLVISYVLLKDKKLLK